MKRVTITREAANVVRSLAKNNFKDSYEPLTPTEGTVLLSEDTINRLFLRRFEGESISDTIIRVCKTAGKELN
jgi:hypothetical protein